MSLWDGVCPVSPYRSVMAWFKPTSRRIQSNLDQVRRRRPHFDRSWAKSGRCRPKFGGHRPNFGRLRAKADRCRSNSRTGLVDVAQNPTSSTAIGFGQIWWKSRAELDRTGPKMCKSAKRLPTLGCIGRVRLKAGQIRPRSMEFQAILGRCKANVDRCSQISPGPNPAQTGPEVALSVRLWPEFTGLAQSGQ